MKRGSAAVAVLSGLAPLSLANKGLVGYRARLSQRGGRGCSVGSCRLSGWWGWDGGAGLRAVWPEALTDADRGVKVRAYQWPNTAHRASLAAKSTSPLEHLTAPGLRAGVPLRAWIIVSCSHLITLHRRGSGFVLRVDYARWGQTPEDLRHLAVSAPHARTRERALALFDITQHRCATQVAVRTGRRANTVMDWASASACAKPAFPSPARWSSSTPCTRFTRGTSSAGGARVRRSSP